MYPKAHIENPKACEYSTSDLSGALPGDLREVGKDWTVWIILGEKYTRGDTSDSGSTEHLPTCYLSHLSIHDTLERIAAGASGQVIEGRTLKNNVQDDIDKKIPPKGAREPPECLNWQPFAHC